MTDNIPSPTDRPRYRQVEEAAARYGVSRWSIRDCIRQGRIRAKKFGRVVLVDVDSADSHFSSLPDASYAPLKRDLPRHP